MSRAEEGPTRYPVWTEVYGRGNVRVGQVMALAACGEAFDDACGDCLICYPDCPESSGRWVLYTDMHDEQLERIFGPLFAVLSGAVSSASEVAS